MSQNRLMDSSTRSLKTPTIKPALAAALASLEVQLDQELARYRRTRFGVRAVSQPLLHNYVSSPQPEATAKTSTVGNTQPLAVEISKYTPPTPVTQTPPTPPSVEISKYTPPTPDTQTPPAPPSTAKTETPQKPEIPSSLPESNTQIPLPPPNAASGIIPTTAQANQNHQLLADDTPTEPDDYLESSEALLRSLTDEQPQTDSQPSNASDSLLSPLGIGSILLLLLASLMLGYVVFNPKSLPQLNFSQLFNNESDSTVEIPEVVNANSQPQPQPELTPIPRHPNLAAKEFPQVRDSNDIVGLQPKLLPTPTAPSNPVAIPTPAIPPVTNPVAQVQTLPSLDESPSPQPSPSPTATSTQTNAEIKPAADGLYYIVADNQGANALATAKQVVPDAYLSPGKTLIYLGALNTKEQAQQRLKQLQAKGIQARVQQP
ncbi:MULTISPECIES: SPOR domain-containing protein [unclassified Anabaena]|uniref:SPOR domain-containing protein n=1 Tax=unclassified Anabaena TaxID=2619674 RepID=UPI00082AC643|nr:MULTISPECIES: SPOR domain-containing protein [unclassified Anabaena]